MVESESHNDDQDQAEESKEEVTYRGITELTQEELFTKLRKMTFLQRFEAVTIYCLSRALATKGSPLNEDARLEYLKESGRRDRSILKSDGTDSNDDDDPIFSK